MKRSLLLLLPCLLIGQLVTAAPKQISFKGTVKSGEAFEKDLGDFVFSIAPDRAPRGEHSNGWHIELTSKHTTGELVCLPMHGCSNCMIDPICMVFQRDSKLHLPDERVIDVGLGAPDYSGYSDNPKDPNWDPPTMRIPSFKKRGVLKVTITDAKLEDANKKDTTGTYPLAWFSMMSFEGTFQLPQ